MVNWFEAHRQAKFSFAPPFIDLVACRARLETVVCAYEEAPVVMVDSEPCRKAFARLRVKHGLRSGFDASPIGLAPAADNLVRALIKNLTSLVALLLLARGALAADSPVATFVRASSRDPRYF